jgi:hypothetical protein
MQYNLKNHPTRYKSTLFRSRLEARWAAFFDLMGWCWQYEPIDLEGWTPDFLVEIPCNHSECNSSQCPACGKLSSHRGPWAERFGCTCDPPYKDPGGGTHDLFVEVKPFEHSHLFDSHILNKYKERWLPPHPMGIGLNPYVSTFITMVHGAGGGKENMESLVKGWGNKNLDVAWAEAGNITRYQPPKEVQ